MIMDTEAIKRTKSLGLNTYEVKIWTALLSRGVSTAGELSDIANVPRSRSYDVLESLEKKGFVVMKLGKPIKYLAVPPKEVLERVKKQIEIKTKYHISSISEHSFSALIRDLQKNYEKIAQSESNPVAVLKGHTNLQRHIAFLAKNTNKEIYISSESTEEASLPITEKNKNVNVSKYNSGLRVFLFDGTDSVLIPASEKDIHKDYSFGLWVKNPEITNFFRQLLITSK